MSYNISYTINVGRRVYCICDPGFEARGGGRGAGRRKVYTKGEIRGNEKCVGIRMLHTCLDMIIFAIDTGTSV